LQSQASMSMRYSSANFCIVFDLNTVKDDEISIGITSAMLVAREPPLVSSATLFRINGVTSLPLICCS
jgi:hypothetical protein